MTEVLDAMRERTVLRIANHIQVEANGCWTVTSNPSGARVCRACARDKARTARAAAKLQRESVHP